MIEDTTAILLDTGEGDGPALITFGQFLRINRDAIDAGDVDPEAIRDTLAAGRQYRGGGGAAPVYLVSIPNTL